MCLPGTCPAADDDHYFIYYRAVYDNSSSLTISLLLSNWPVCASLSLSNPQAASLSSLSLSVVSLLYICMMIPVFTSSLLACLCVALYVLAYKDILGRWSVLPVLAVAACVWNKWRASQLEGKLEQAKLEEVRVLLSVAKWTKNTRMKPRPPQNPTCSFLCCFVLLLFFGVFSTGFLESNRSSFRTTDTTAAAAVSLG